MRSEPDDWSEFNLESGSAEYYSYIYRCELSNSLQTKKIRHRLEHTNHHGSQIEWSEEAQISAGDTLLAEASSSLTWTREQVLPCPNGYFLVNIMHGSRASICPLAFPFGFSDSDIFALKTIRSFDYTRRYSGPVPDFPGEMEKSLISPHEDEISLDLSSRPMGWTQIQTEGNAHVLQGVLIINDETSEVVDAMLWHNGDRIEASLASVLGCGVTDLLGVLYLPQASMGGGGDPDLPDDPDPGTTNGPTGFAAFCQDNPGHPSCVSNGCATVLFSEELLSQLQAVNDAVNGAHTYESDAILYRKLEHWTVLTEGASGDCEDFALTKVDALIAAGIPAGAVKLVVGKAGNGEGHAWVEVQTTNGNYALDINYTEVKPTSSLPYTDLQRQYDGVWWL